MCHYTSGKKKCQIITEYSVLEVCLLICTQPSHQKINLTKNNLNRVSPFFGLGTEIWAFNGYEFDVQRLFDQINWKISDRIS